MQLFFVRVAKAAHGYAHIKSNEKFDEPSFCREIKYKFYNTQRNELKRKVIASQAGSNSDNLARKESEATTATPDMNPVVRLERYEGLVRIQDGRKPPTPATEEAPVMTRTRAVTRTGITPLADLELCIDLGGSLGDVIQKLEKIVAAAEKKKGVKRALDRVKELLVILANTPESEDWTDIIHDYTVYIAKL